MGSDDSGKPWVCTTGKQQSPINILTSGAATRTLANEHRATYELGAVSSNGSNVVLVNDGHSVQVSWTRAGFDPKITITVKGRLMFAAAKAAAGGVVCLPAAVVWWNTLLRAYNSRRQHCATQPMHLSAQSQGFLLCAVCPDMWALGTGFLGAAPVLHQGMIKHLSLPRPVCNDAADGQAVASSADVNSGDKVQQVVTVPQQFHFHAHSEHLLQGKQCWYSMKRT